MYQIILCHQTVDFDALGAAVGLTRLRAGAKLVLTGGAHPGVKNFLALYRDELLLIEQRSVTPQRLKRIMVVDTQQRDRLGKSAAWLDLPQLEAIEVYDHHWDSKSDIPATFRQVENVGATTTLIVEKLQDAGVSLTFPEATVMALGIHVDTGSLTFDQTTPRDVRALAWLMEQGADLQGIRDYIDPGLTPRLQKLLSAALEGLERAKVQSYTITWVCLDTEGFVPGLSSIAERLMDLTEADALFFGVQYQRSAESGSRLTVIGRSRIPNTTLLPLFQAVGGGGHAQATSATLKNVNASDTLQEFVNQLIDQLPHPLTARDIMSSPVRTIRPHITIAEAQRILLRYGHSGLSVVNENDQLVGIICRRDLDLALHHGFQHAPVKGYMSQTDTLKTITPETTMPEIESLMVTYDVGRLPVIEQGHLVGIVTRTDVLRVRQGENWGMGEMGNRSSNGKRHRWASCLIPKPQDLIPAGIWQFLEQVSQQAEQRGWHLYLVGGAVRDLIMQQDAQKGRGTETASHEGASLAPLKPSPTLLQDIDLVVDGFHRTAQTGAGVELAKAVQEQYPQARLEVHGAFQTAALLWHKDPTFSSLAVDIATARTEFYPYPAANPEVEASSIRQDLYRRDFTINALAIRLTSPREGELLDFFGGLLDLRSHTLRVLHANSFIEDPTRIYRAVRFAVRLGFHLEAQTEQYIRYAITSGVYDRSRSQQNPAPALTTRLKAELRYILEAPYWKPALELLNDLGALRCLHPTLELNPRLWWQIRLLDRGLQRFDPQHQLDHWQLRLELLLAELAAPEGWKVAQSLELSADGIKRLKLLPEARQRLIKVLGNHGEIPPSQIVQTLRDYSLAVLALLAVKTPRQVRRQIWHYLIDLSHRRAPLNGHDLKQMGYKPGPLYREILETLLSATLDGVIGDRPQAEVFLKQYFPLSKNSKQ
ncbi:CBS domain-containing protein [Spirulina subsalsa FACHB-351]|uniref:CBS domain-containing protein n=1 Tax=Spirulina subsalsa FACHB-351 TaxID=234711 RepID=A0ABT3L4C3_9CYAN|nr:CBS domain-containing protein [Spirulina subsalsa]MCW6036352.1 CBS domain-containing protein [Spirulina subsalsa FACHB-351]